MRGRHSFALTEVLISLVLLALCASMTAPYFRDMYACYQSIADRMRGEYMVSEYLVDAYSSYLKNPPPFEEIVKGMRTETTFGGLTIVRVLEVVPGDVDDNKTSCLANLTVEVLKGKASLAKGSMSLCFQKKVT